MRTAQVTRVNITPAPGVNGFRVEIAWRYGTAGSFIVASASALVNQNGTLSVPVYITFDETINPTIQIRTTYKDALGCNPHYYSHTSGEVTTSAPTPTTAATTTISAPTTLPASTTTTQTTGTGRVQWFWTPTDPYTALQSADNNTYTNGNVITDNAAPFQANLSGAPTDYFFVVRVPATVSTKTTWYETSFNNGAIPDQIFRAAFTLRGFTYYVTRIQATFSATLTDRVTFS